MEPGASIKTGVIDSDVSVSVASLFLKNFLKHVHLSHCTLSRKIYRHHSCDRFLYHSKILVM